MGVGGISQVCHSTCASWFNACQRDYFKLPQLIPCKQSAGDETCKPLKKLLGSDGPVVLCTHYGLQVASESTGCYDNKIPAADDACRYTKEILSEPEIDIDTGSDPPESGHRSLWAAAKLATEAMLGSVLWPACMGCLALLAINVAKSLVNVYDGWQDRQQQRLKRRPVKVVKPAGPKPQAASKKEE